MLRDRLLARIHEMGDAPDHQRLAAEVLGIRGAPPALARKLVMQALVLEDRQEDWRRTRDRVCRGAPTARRTAGLPLRARGAEPPSCDPRLRRRPDSVGKELGDLLVVKTGTASAVDPPPQASAERIDVGWRCLRAPRRDERPDTTPAFDDPFEIELTIGLQHRVRIDRQRRHDLFDGR